MLKGLCTASYPAPDLAAGEAFHARLIELGATPLQPITDVGGGIRVAAVLDPFGNRFSFMDNPYFKG